MNRKKPSGKRQMNYLNVTNDIDIYATTSRKQPSRQSSPIKDGSDGQKHAEGSGYAGGRANRKDLNIEA